MIMVTMADVRELKYCSAGARSFCKTYGFDFREFVRKGLSADEVLATGDQFAMNVANLAIKKASK